MKITTGSANYWLPAINQIILAHKHITKSLKN